MFSGSGYIRNNVFYSGVVGGTSESHEYYSAALLHSKLAACSERAIIYDKENRKRNFIYFFEL